jgi:hypothetical protein
VAATSKIQSRNSKTAKEIGNRAAHEGNSTYGIYDENRGMIAQA